VTANPPGEVPEQLEDHLFEEGSTETGTVVVDGTEMPASAASLSDPETEAPPSRRNE